MARTIGRYEIQEELGRGGMGVVYLADDSRLDRQVALKLLDQQLSADSSFAARFEQEARTVAGLSHTAIVSLYDCSELKKVVELNPTHSYQFTVLARAYKFLGNYEAMHQAYQQSIAVGAANDPFPHTNYAYNIYPDLASFDEAMAILYDCEAKLTSNAPSCAWERAALSDTVGRTADAVAAYERYLELVPQGIEVDRQQQSRDYIDTYGS